MSWPNHRAWGKTSQTAVFLFSALRLRWLRQCEIISRTRRIDEQRHRESKRFSPRCETILDQLLHALLRDPHDPLAFGRDPHLRVLPKPCPPLCLSGHRAWRRPGQKESKSTDLLHSDDDSSGDLG